MTRKVFLLLALLLVACRPAPAAPSAPGPANPTLILATTTSTQDSGLLDVLIPLFEQQSGYVVQTIAVGSGAALQMGREGNADVLLVHAPAAEEEFMASGFGSDRRLVMYNEFVIVGPPDDPAGIRGSAVTTEAMRRIAAASATFVSRGDDSGTHQLERQLWAAAGLDPSAQPWYLESGQGMGATLTIASEREAYTMTDRATYLAHRAALRLDILVEGDPLLRNVYHVIVVNPERWPNTNLEGATAFADFIVSPAAQEVIRTFGAEEYGQPLFFPEAREP
jgi:tungstate transport system substrate-binding protein